MDLVDGRHASKITLVTSNGSFVFVKAFLINELPASSFIFRYKGCSNPLLDGSVKTFGGSTTRKSWGRGTIIRNQNYVTHLGIIIIPAAISLLIFDMGVPLRLNGGKAYNFRFAHDILYAPIAYAFLSGFHDTSWDLIIQMGSKYINFWL